MKLAALIILAISPLLPGQEASSFEESILLQASDLLPPELVRGNTYRVRNLVATDGYMAHFEIDSDYGTFTATGVPAVKRRITEIGAIGRLVETSRGDLFAEGLKRSIEQPIDAVKNIVQNPVGSVKRAPQTVGHFFKKIGSPVSREVSRVEERIREDDEPSPAEIGRGIGAAAKNIAGFEKAKLDTARQLGVDPYSDNPRLQEEIDKVTWAFFAGGLPLRIGAMAASAGLAVTATNMIGIPEDTYALTRAELALRDQRSLEAMGVEDADIRAFLDNPALGVTNRHRIVVALESLGKARGRGDIIRLANSCNTEGQAYFLVNSLLILTERQRSTGSGYVALYSIGRIPAATQPGGELIVPAPVDHVTWTPEVAAFAQRDDFGTAPRILLHTGRFSDAATQGFAAAGWRTVSIPYSPQ